MPAYVRLALRLLVCALSGLLAIDAWAAQLLIVRSDDPLHKVGGIIDGTQPLRVPDGRSLTLIAQNGRIVRIKGPHRSPPDASIAVTDDSVLTTLSNLVSGDGAQSKMAVFRGGRKRPANELVLLDKGGLRCTTGDRAPQLSIKYAPLTGELSLKNDDGVAVRVPWPARTRTMEWPEMMPYQHGQRYLVRYSYAGESLEVRIVTSPNALPSNVHFVAWMAERGCTRDARRMLDELVR